MRVLVVAYNYPPVGGAGVQRNLRLVSHLSRLGVELAVVTGPGLATNLWAPHDDALAAEAPPDVAVYRVPTPEPGIGAVQARLQRIARIETGWGRWWSDGVVSEGVRAGAGCDLVWALMQPYASARPVAEVASRLDVPWVADLADPWALDEMRVYPSALHRSLELREMRRALSSSAGIVMSTPEAAARLARGFPELAARPIAVGPVGWDRADFAEPPPPVRSADGRVRIVHTGYLHTELGRSLRRSRSLRLRLGGTEEDVDVLTRSHVHLLRAIDALHERRPELRGVVELVLAGVQSEADRDETGARADVRMLGYVTHPEAVALMPVGGGPPLSADARPPGRPSSATIVPGKTYEYLAAGRPILAAVPRRRCA